MFALVKKVNGRRDEQMTGKMKYTANKNGGFIKEAVPNY